MWPPVPPAAITMLGARVVAGSRVAIADRVSQIPSEVDHMTALDLSTSQRIHVIAAGGKAMNAIVRILRAMGHDVSGCDAAGSKVTASLEALGIDVRIGHDASHVSGVD